MPPDGEQLDSAALQEENARLRAELESARRVASEEQGRANQLSVQNAQAGARVASAQQAQLDAQEVSVGNTLTSIDQEIKGLKSRLIALNTDGKFEEAADIQEQIGDATARRRQAMQEKAYLANQKTQLAAVPSDPIEQFLVANRGNFTSEDENWIRQNRRYAEDPNFRNRVIGAHTEAVEKLGLQQRSPEYYRHLERRGYMRQEEPPQQQQQQQQQQAQPSGVGDAPTGYSDADDGGGGPELVITPRSVNQETNMPPADTGGPAFGRRAENPQPRAAGTGSLRQAVAGSPSRRSPVTPGRRTVLEMTQDDYDTAIAMAPHLAPDEVRAGGSPAIAQWWNDLRNSPTARRMKENWQA